MFASRSRHYSVFEVPDRGLCRAICPIRATAMGYRGLLYMEKLTTIPNLMYMVTNPFLLILSLGALPSVVQNKKDLKTVRITRVALYDSFVHHWIGANQRRLEKQKLKEESRTVLDELIDADFERNGVEYQKRLATAIFQEQEGRPVVDYTRKLDKLSWKAEFFGPESEPTLLRACSLLNRVDNQYRFIHRYVLEYFYSRYIHETSRQEDKSSPTTRLDAAVLARPIADHHLSQRNLVSEPSIIQFLSERVHEDDAYKEHLLAIIEKSKTDAEASQATSNSITILVRAGIMFNGADLEGIRIPGADLSYGQVDSVPLQGADLSNTNLRSIWLRQANLNKTQMAGVQFGEWPSLEEEVEVGSCAYAPDGKTFVVGLSDGAISVYKTATWERANTLRGHTSRVWSVVFSPSCQQIASGSDDITVRLWDAITGAPGAILSGHTDDVNSVVFSPSGQQIASGSDDQTIRLWDVDSGRCLTVVKGFYGMILSVAWNAYGNGSCIATGCADKSVRLWQVKGDHHLVHLRWSSTHDRLVVSDTSIFDAQGLSKTNSKLLVQRAAVGQPMFLKEP